ncbi:hypothetical protein [Candidatus Methanodesulfokora washburnensis]|uniref:Uncharacterized protein n=1 Tax=Candidatus Methanodesulfokora washburnensis TaxID=2478471 RepID=A0A3R9QUK2_9CREN|nr:hypothetical protein [Candidatus Methanodesulfokores washburnensis]RSN73763.1 hypothetical protein D6D85_09555 [Candidatus Methanodesulfokores washburnensis]
MIKVYKYVILRDISNKTKLKGIKIWTELKPDSQLSKKQSPLRISLKNLRTSLLLRGKHTNFTTEFLKETFK